MAIVRWDPFRNVMSLQDRINRMFNEAFPRTWEGGEDIAIRDWNPAVDIFEKNDAIVIHAEIPGVKKEDVSVEFKDGVLSLKGQREFDKEVKEDNYYRRERSFGSFQRSFTLPDVVDVEKIKANFKDGVLEIEIPKLEEKKPKQIEVKIE
jgi:HSP20 family protein